MNETTDNQIDDLAVTHGEAVAIKGESMMNEQNPITITDLEAPNADEIKGGETVTVGDEQDEEAAIRRTTVSAKIRRPGK